MPPRIARSSVKSSGSRGSNKKNKKAQKRSLNAFAIASHEAPDRIKIRQHCLGESEVDHSRRKRHREEDDDEEEEEEPSEGRRRKQKKVEKDRFDELSIDGGSDSDGNTWQMGYVDDDDDSDIDSDEAFGESDEERFEGWVFRGSSSNQKSKPRKRPQRMDNDEEDINLDEGESGEEDDEDNESLGEDAVDLATMLDQYDEEEEEAAKPRKSSKKRAREYESDEGPSSEDDIGRDGASDLSMSEEEEEDEESEDDNDPTSSSKLKNLISSLQPDEEPVAKAYRQPEAHESATPTEFGVSKKVDISSFKRKGADAEEKKRALKLLRDDIKPSKRNDIARKLDAPLPKRQQDKIDRAAASEKANETLGRWVDTVKQNRRAEHISFPLKHKDAGEALGEKSLMPTTTVAPANDLESTIQSILQESGLSAKNGKSEEDQIQKWEELQTNKLPLEEVQARRAELRKARELLFREEIRAKRIKKIKSKAYRRVHRKERERLAQRERDALIADGVNLSDEEREHNDRRRAEERMGAKHRDSKWAKGVKKSGKAAWDDDARAGVTEMARRNEELRRRIEGKEIGDEDQDVSDLSSEEEGDEEENEDLADKRLRNQLGRLSGEGTDGETKLGSMIFMQRAEAARKARNDEDVERMRRELAGEESQSDEEDENAVGMGRRKFGPATKSSVVPAIQPKASEFEERADSDAEAGDDRTDDINISTTKSTVNGSTQPAATKAKGRKGLSASTAAEPSTNPYLTKQPKGKESSALWKAEDTLNHLQTGSKKASKGKSSEREIISAPDSEGWQTVSYQDNDDEDNDDIENDGVDLDQFLRNQALTAQAFGEDGIEAEFTAAKNELVKEQDEQIEDATLPGWGSWVGEGLSKRAQAKNKGRVLRKQEGIAANKRKDAKLDRVIINEKRIGKNAKYLATTLPFPFESREQYERSLRLPKGPEWTTKQTYQDGTKPRVLLKQGVIRPMAKPLV